LRTISYPGCPKCGHAPLPADQSLPAACPACGIVLAKFGAALCFRLPGYPVIYTGWYMHDAGDPQGMMLSGKSSAEDDGHDFVNLFGYFGAWWFDHATRVGVFVARVGHAMMCAGIAWGAYMLWLQKSQLSDSPFAESPVDREWRRHRRR
jgi:hypothetical protein